MENGVDEGTYPFEQCWRDYRFQLWRPLIALLTMAPSLARQHRTKTGMFSPTPTETDRALRKMYEEAFNPRLVAALTDAQSSRAALKGLRWSHSPRGGAALELIAGEHSTGMENAPGWQRLDMKDADSLAGALTCGPRAETWLQRLSLFGCEMTVDGLHVLAPQMARCARLTQLDLRNCGLREAGAAVLAGLAARLGGAAAWPFLLLAVAAGIWHVVPRALGAALHLRPDMHLLMCVAIAGAMGIGEWIEAASVAFLYSLSLALEAWSVGRARRAVEELLALAPATATLLDGERTLPAEEVEPGSRILVRPGERVPVRARDVIVARRQFAIRLRRRREGPNVANMSLLGRRPDVLDALLVLAYVKISKDTAAAA